LLINRLHQFRFAFAGVHSTPKYELFDIYETCMPITHLWYHESKRKKLRFVYDELRGCSKLFSSKELFQFVIFNVVSNAIKYSRNLSEVQLYAKDNSDGRIRIGVRNKGIGIPEEERNYIFSRGFRAENARRYDSRGMGIGLSVCRQICSVLRGTIQLLEKTEPWTVFEISLPQKGEKEQ